MPTTSPDTALSDNQPSPYDYTFTVFTPTYNRAHTLSRVYHSLAAQTFRDFEWLIVDDGSTDGTGDLVAGWQAKADFAIRYVWQENGGKHIATNRGVAEARGELFLTLDSDDECVPEALERFKYHWDSIPAEQRIQFSAVTALARNQHGEVLGSRFPHDPTDSESLEIHYKYGVAGEKWGFQRTDVMRAFPFPDLPGVGYMPEGVVWSQIAARYKTRFVNETLRIYFQERDRRLFNDPVGTSYAGRLYAVRLFLNLDYPFPLTALLRFYADYVRLSIYERIGPLQQVRQIPNAGYWLLALPMGIAVYLRDQIRRRLRVQYRK